jgi:UDP-N-acetylglucosamine diphosphorylase / glucose-1-phosphate thymidylyltransferase / UDP-N-acetylgalactosamine diphosphorylase / glucosamine-1-phosphate N-acetyltransferase / galactosamine-1-phosphate N-acetyltransferase
VQGVILAAGHGSRLQPITLTRSKAMVPILGKPIVERVMEDLQANGVDDFVLVVGTDDRHISRYFRHESTIAADVRFVYQPQRLGMANALQCAAPLISSDFILSACDNLISAGHIANMMAAWQSDPRPNAVLTLMPVEPERLGNVGIVELDGPWVTRIVEKPPPDEAPSNISSLPLYCFSRRILDYLDEVPLSPRGEYELQDAIQMVIEREGRVRGLLVDKRLTLTSPADILDINRHYLLNGRDKPQLAPFTVGPNTQLVTPLRIEAGTIIGRDCIIGPNVYVERDCRIGDGAVIRNAVLLRECSVPAGAHVQDQVVS